MPRGRQAEGGFVLTMAALTDGKIKKAVLGIKGKIDDAAKQYGIGREKIADLAPRVFGAQGLFRMVSNWVADTHNVTIGLADFARLLDPSVPEKADDYRKHRMYYSLAYMQRVQRTAEKPQAGKRGSFKPAPAKLERMLRTVLTIVKPESVAAFWVKFGHEFGLDQGQLRRLQARVAITEPVLDLSVVMKPIDVSGVNVTHMEGADQKRGAEAGESRIEAQAEKGAAQLSEGRRVLHALQAKGRRVKRAA